MKRCPDCDVPIAADSEFCRSCAKSGARHPNYGGMPAATRAKISATRRRVHTPHPNAGNHYAWRYFPLPALCDRCKDAPPKDRHHKDGDALNNAASNIAFLCRRCHLLVDGRHARLEQEIPTLGGQARQRQVHAIFDGVRKDTLHCAGCHEWMPDTAFSPDRDRLYRRQRARECRVCAAASQRARRARKRESA